MRLSNWIAFRYLRSKKSNGAVSAIAGVSIAGVTIATAAVICVLSVFNGFKSVLEVKFDTMAPDIVVSPAKGKVISNPDSLAEVLQKIAGVKESMPVVTDKALAIFGGKELPVTIKGVEPEKMSRISGIKDAIIPPGKMPASYYEEMPEFEYIEDYEEYLANTPKPEALPSIGAAVRLGNMIDGDEFMLFAPRREGRFNPANPSASFVADSVKISGIYETKQREYDEDMIIVPIDLARHLFQYEEEASELNLMTAENAAPGEVSKQISSILGPGFVVKDRAEMQEINFRMINIEKWVSFLLLAFILMIAGFNVISTMTMLVLEKRRQMSVMSALGMRNGRIGRVFGNESIMVSLLGGVIGVILGVFLCWLQQQFGLIKLAGDPSKLIMATYPVKLIWTDVLLAFIPCVVLGIITAFISSSFARSRITAVTSE